MMPHITLCLREAGDGAWPDLKEKLEAGAVIHTTSAQVAALPGGMQSGATSVTFRFDLADGQVVICETSLKMLLTIADGLKARYGDPREQS